jgi:PhnB protein
MAEAVKPIPEGYHTITPALIVNDARGAIEFYKRAFDASVRGVADGPGGKVIHAEIKIGDSIVMLSDEFPEWGSLSPRSAGGKQSMSLHIYVTDADAAFKRAVDAGATVVMPIMDAFWGDRYGQLTDPYGHKWSIGTHKKDMTREEMQKAQDEAFSKMAGCGGSGKP